MTCCDGTTWPFWYAWLFNRTEGSLQAQGWIYVGVWCAVALGLLVADWKAWRRPTPVPHNSLIPEGSR